MTTRTYLATACLTLSVLASPAALAANDAQPMDAGRLGRVARTIGLDRSDFIAAVEIDRDLQSFGIDLDASAAAHALADRVRSEVDRLIEDGSWSPSADLAGQAVALDINEPWEAPLGLDWLGLNGATVVGMYENDGSLSLSIVGFARVGDVPMATRISLDVSNSGEPAIHVNVSAESVTLGVIRSMVAGSGLPAPLADVADDALVLRDMEASFTLGNAIEFTMTGTMWLRNAIEAEAMLTLTRPQGGEPQVILAMRVHEWTLADLFSELRGTVADEVRFPAIAFSVARDIGQIRSIDLDPAALEFYRPVLGDDFTFSLDEGITFDGTLPLSRLPSSVVAAMGMNQRDAITVEGSLDLSIELLGGGMPVDLDGLTLEAALPPARNLRLPPSLQSLYTMERVLRFSYADDTFTLGVANTLSMQIDGGVRTFDLAADMRTGGDSDSLWLSGSMREAWHQPFGLEWLTLEDVRVQTIFTDEGMRTVLESSFDVAGKSMDMRLVVAEEGGQRQIMLRASVDEFSTGEIRQLMAQLFPNAAIFDGEALINVPFRDIVMTMEIGESQKFSLRASTMIRGQDADVMIAGTRENETTNLLAAFRLDEFELVDAFPALDGTLVDELGLRFPGATIVVASDAQRISADSLGRDAARFFRESCKSDDFDFDIQSGMNLVSTLRIPQSSMTSMLSYLGIGGGDREYLVTGTLPSGFLSGNASGMLSDLALRIPLPRMTPPNAPQWFVSAELAVEITGQPSVGLVGEITVDIEGDILTFFIEGNVARTGAGFSLALVGGLSADQPWQSPFGLHWLVFNDARIKLSISPAGNLGLGFAGDMVIGDKDIDTAVFVAVNMYTGVPTNFIFEGQSEAGVALSDIVELQHQIMTLGLPFLPPLDCDRLPDVSVRNLHVKFAPRDEPDLGVERGFLIEGECWARPTPCGEMTFIGQVAFSIDEAGIVASGSTGAFDIGPVHFDAGHTSLAIGFGRQELKISGLVRIGSRQVEADIELTRDGLNGEVLGEVAEHARAAAEAVRAAVERVWERLTWWN